MLDLQESQFSDEEIAKKVQSGNKEIFDVLVKRYEAKITRYARKFLSNYGDIEDLVQEVFVKAYVNIRSFDASRKFSPWIYRIAHNEFINAIRKKGKEPLPFFDLDILLPHPISDEDADKDIESKDARRMIEECLDKMNVKYKEPLVLYYLEEMEYKEIAEVLHVPISTVGVRLKRGKQIMKIYCKNLNQ